MGPPGANGASAEHTTNMTAEWVGDCERTPRSLQVRVTSFVYCTGVNAPYGVREGVPELMYVYVYIRVPLQARVIAFHPNSIANDGVRHHERVWDDSNGKPPTPLTDACTVFYTHSSPKAHSSTRDRRWTGGELHRECPRARGRGCRIARGGAVSEVRPIDQWTRMRSWDG